MQRFNKTNINELKDFIYYGFAHDALLEDELRIVAKEVMAVNIKDA